MLGETNKRKAILDALRSGKITGNCTPEVAKNIVVEKIELAEFELLVNVIGAEEYDIKVKQGRTVITDPEGDGYAVDADKNIKVIVTAGDKELEFAYRSTENKDLEFNFEEGTVIEK